MDQAEYQRRLEEAMTKAVAARAPNVQGAYVDLANFYREKLGRPTSSPRDLSCCCTGPRD